MAGGFKDFLLRGNVVDLAVGVIIGASFGKVVDALVKSLITPLIAAIGGQPDFSALSFTLNNSKFAYGEFINAIISFVIIAAVVYYFVVLPINNLIERSKKGEAAPAATTRPCPECLTDIPLKAKRCPACTSQVA
jgi:large conductance mechanosensitive channel